MSNIVEYIQSGEIELAKELLAHSPDLAPAVTENGVSALMLARYMGHTDLAEKMASLHPGLNVFEAAALGHVDRLRQLVSEDPSLVSQRSPDGFTALGFAAYFNHPSAVEVLIAAGAPVDEVSKNREKVAPLHSALSGQHTQAIHMLVEAGADVNQASGAGWTPLHYVATTNDVEVARYLIEHGAKVGPKNSDGKTALEIATEAGHQQLVDLLQKA